MPSANYDNLSRNTSTYGYDEGNRLTNITTKTSGGTVTHEVDYTYDIFNRRIGKTIDADGDGAGTATEEIYIYDGLRQERGAAGDHILLAFDESDDLTDRFLYGPNVDQVLASEEVTSTASAGDVLWALTDHLGTVRDVADYNAGTNTTTVQNHLTYNAFGNITAEANAAVDFLFAFTGRERDEESDLQLNRERYYDPAVGRWVSEDPLEFEAGDMNLSRYVSNAATYFMDPSGLWAQEGGTEWRATDPGDTFLALLDLVDPEKKLRQENVMGIIPVKTGVEELDEEVKTAYDSNSGFDAKAVPCGLYDTKHLEPTSGANLIIAVGTDKTRNYTDEALTFFKRSFVDSNSVTPLHIYKLGVLKRKLEEYSGKGETPIRGLLLIGHGAIGSTHIGSLDENGLVISPGLASSNFKWSKYDEAILSHLSPGFYYTTNATIRVAGCQTKEYAEFVASNLLRGTDRAIACSIPIKTSINLVQHRLVPAGAEAFSADVIFDGSVLL
ncbi:RHS repeat domain-containing protein [Bremerella cremea]|uniref:RHS repeat domain-containing protein n=1 Tax=Bremerella cremea TaxID=1031537 RepID=UPI00131498EB|nr:RHS repeat-associated core domain-containing protein [Bremerella cremea]